MDSISPFIFVPPISSYLSSLKFYSQLAASSPGPSVKPKMEDQSFLKLSKPAFGSMNTAFTPYLRAGSGLSQIADNNGRDGLTNLIVPKNSMFEHAGWILLSSVRWAHSVPSFLQLPQQDQLLLLRNCWLELFALTYVQVRNGRRKTNLKLNPTGRTQ
jgi:Ligand-binding domain of nuclear hormone receptor